MRPRTTHVIFDLDGTLIDSEHIYTKACQDISKLFGRIYSDNVCNAVRGLSQREATPAILEMTGLKDYLTIDGFDRLLDTIMFPRLPQCTLMPGAIETVRHLAAHQIPMAICTGSVTQEMKLKLENLKELRELIPIVVTGDDLEIRSGKPSPDPYLVAMKRFPQKPQNASNVVVFEDTLVGVRSASSAGARVTMVYDQRYTVPPKDLNVECVVNSFNNLNLAELGLPPLLWI